MTTSKHWPSIIEEYLENIDTVTEVETNGGTSVFIKEKGVRKEINGVFLDEEDYINKTRALAYLIDEKKTVESFADYEYPEFLVEGKLILSGGRTARVHIVLPPACETPQVTIAKKSKALGSLASIRDRGSFDTVIYDFLKACVRSKQTIVISGGTGSGKSTILEAMSQEFNDNDRIGVVEDSQELQLSQKNVTYLHSTLWIPGTDKNSVATLSWCVQQINRQRTDKLIIGETRGAEFADFIVGANSGMEGSLTTIHANNPRAALQKMTQFVSLAQPQATARTINESIASAVDIIIQLGFDKHKKNRLLSIVEVSETLGNTDSAQIATHPLFKFNENTEKWEFEGYLSQTLTTKFENHGFDPRTFKAQGALAASVRNNRFSK